MKKQQFLKILKKRKSDNEFQNAVRKAGQELASIFGNNKEEPNYSLGFQRWSRLSLSEKKALMFKNDFNYQDCINELEYA